MLQSNTVIWLGLICVCIVLLCMLMYYVYYLEKPSPGNCSAIKEKDPSVKWSDGCSSIQELVPDASLSAPSVAPYLTKFTASPSLGPAWGVNVWYSLRAVKGSTGGYSSLGPWTSSPISAGSTTLPCKGDICPSSFTYSGKDACQCNLPELQIDSLGAYGITSGVYYNVHRYVTSIDDTSPPNNTQEGTVVGMLIPNGKGGGIFIDINSPCSEGNCQTIQGC